MKLRILLLALAALLLAPVASAHYCNNCDWGTNCSHHGWCTVTETDWGWVTCTLLPCEHCWGICGCYTEGAECMHEGRGNEVPSLRSQWRIASIVISTPRGTETQHRRELVAGNSPSDVRGR